ncbi:prevent-host-death protein [Kribbella sp. NPDC002412]
MAAIVEAVASVEDLTGAKPTVVGGLAVLARLSSAHRATIDLDIVDRRANGQDRQLEILRTSSDTTPAEPAGVLVPTSYGDVRVDVLEVNQHELDHPSDDVGDRLHARSHAWAADSASTMAISVVTSGRNELVRASTKVAEPGPLIAMKLQAIMDRGDDKAGTDLWDIIRLGLDPVCRPLALEQLRACDRQLAADIAQHVEGWFRIKRDWALDRLLRVAGTAVVPDDVDLVADLLADACSRST